MEAMMRRLPPAARTQLYPIIQQIDEDGKTTNLQSDWGSGYARISRSGC